MTVPLDVFAELAASAPLLPCDQPSPPESSATTDDSSTDIGSTTSEDLSTASITKPSSPFLMSGKRSGGKRTIHNVCERRRRENIREAFRLLQVRVVPLAASSSSQRGENLRASKMEVLRRAIERIERGRKELALLEAELAKYRT